MEKLRPFRQKSRTRSKTEVFMAKAIDDTTRTMTQLCNRVEVHWSLFFKRVSFVGSFCFHFIWDRILSCSLGRPAAHYRRLSLRRESSPPADMDGGGSIMQAHPTTINCGCESDSDLVNLKISLLGDCHIGKTSFVVCMLRTTFSFSHIFFFFFFFFFIFVIVFFWGVVWLSFIQ